MVIDFHTHCYPDFLAAKAIAKVDGTEFHPVYNGTYKGLIADNEKNGIDKTVVLCIANRPDHEKQVNDFALEMKGESSLIPFGSVHPFSPNYKYYIDMLSSEGIKGVKFHPHYQGYVLDAQEAIKVYEYAANKGFILLFHGGLDLMVKGDNNTPQKIRRVLDALKYPKTVIAHMGGWGAYEDAIELVAGQDCYIDLSFSYRFVDDDIRKRFISVHDENKILFGTDRPWVDAATDINLIKKLSLAIADKILYKNAQKLLGI